MSFFKRLFGGKKAKTKKIDTLTDSQKQLLDRVIENLGQGGTGFDEDFFTKSFTEPALQEFEDQITPAIQQKFIGAGAGRGSNLQDELTRAGVDVEKSLAGKRAELLNQALNRQLEATRIALGTPAYSVQQQPGETGLVQELVSGLAGGVTGGAGQTVGKEVGQSIVDRVRGRQAQRKGFR